jgi:DNA repair photolyase
MTTFRPIYEPRNRAREYCDLAVNIYTGCPHGCIYCYAPRVLRKTREEFAKVQPRRGIANAVRKQLEHDGIKGKKIMLCFTCDPYPFGVDTTVTEEVIQAIKESGNHVQILTKGGEIARRDFVLLDSNDSFGVTWSGAKQEDEPYAASEDIRYQSIVIAKMVHGIHTWMSCEPVLDPKAIYAAIETFTHVDLFRIGKLNYMPSEINWAKFGRTCEWLCKKYERNYYIKEDLRQEMEK